jgi:hypothetical protein
MVRRTGRRQDRATRGAKSPHGGRSNLAVAHRARQALEQHALSSEDRPRSVTRQAISQVGDAACASTRDSVSSGHDAACSKRVLTAVTRSSAACPPDPTRRHFTNAYGRFGSAPLHEPTRGTACLLDQHVPADFILGTVHSVRGNVPGMVITKDGRGRPSRASVYAAVDQGMAELNRIDGLPGPDAASESWRDIRFEETHNSTAIEGNTLSLKEVRALLEEGRAVGDRELRESSSAR